MEQSKRLKAKRVWGDLDEIFKKFIYFIIKCKINEYTYLVLNIFIEIEYNHLIFFFKL